MLERRCRNKNFIFGFDAFSLNKNRLNHKEIRTRYNSYKDELKQSNFLNKFFNSDITIRSIQHLIKLLKKDNYNKHFIEKNIRESVFSVTDVLNDSGVLNDTPKKNFSSYEIFSSEKIIELAKLATKEDIFVILPKHFFYYKLFS